MPDNQPQLEQLRNLIKDPEKAAKVLKKYKLLMDTASATLVGDYSQKLGEELISDTIAELKNANNEKRNEIISSFENKLKNMSKAIGVDLELLAKREIPEPKSSTFTTEQSQKIVEASKEKIRSIKSSSLNGKVENLKANLGLMNTNLKKFDTLLEGVLSKVIFTPEKDGENLPLDNKFYDTLINIVKERNKLPEEFPSNIARGHVILAQLIELKANAKRASLDYRPGTVIKGKGRIEKVNIINGTYSLELYGGNYPFERNVKPGTDENESPYNKIIKKWRLDADSHLKQATIIALRKNIRELSKSIKIVKNHIPSNGLLAEFINEGWVKLDKNGNTDIVNFDFGGDPRSSLLCPPEMLPHVYEAILKQLQLEQVYLSQNSLDKKDPFYNEKQLIVSAKISLGSNNVYAGLAKILEFLKLSEKIQSPDERLKEYKVFALETHKVFMQSSLSKLEKVAFYLFGTKKDDKGAEQYYNIVLDRINTEKSKIQKSDKLVLSFDDLLIPPPGRSAADKLWNEVVNYENPENYERLTNGAFRQNALAKLADASRYTVDYSIDGSDSSTMRHPDLAVMFCREALSDKIARQQNKLLRKKERLTAMYRDQMENELDSKSMKDALVGEGEGKISEAQFEKAKSELLQNPQYLNRFCAALADAKAQSIIDKDIYGIFQRGGGNLKGLDKQLSASIVSIKGLGLNLSDDSLEVAASFVKEFTQMIIVTIASMNIASTVASAGRIAWIALNGPKAIDMINKGSRAYRYAMFSGESLAFTAVASSLNAICGEKAEFWGELGSNLLMFGSLRAGQKFWRATGGRARSVYEKNAIKIIDSFSTPVRALDSEKFIKAGKWGKRLIRGVDWTGRMAVENIVFSGIGVAGQLKDGANLRDINYARLLGMNLLTIGALRVGSKLSRPLVRPLEQMLSAKTSAAYATALMQKYPGLIIKPGQIAEVIELKSSFSLMAELKNQGFELKATKTGFRATKEGKAFDVKINKSVVDQLKSMITEASELRVQLLDSIKNRRPLDRAFLAKLASLSTVLLGAMSPAEARADVNTFVEGIKRLWDGTTSGVGNAVGGAGDAVNGAGDVIKFIGNGVPILVSVLLIGTTSYVVVKNAKDITGAFRKITRKLRGGKIVNKLIGDENRWLLRKEGTVTKLANKPGDEPNDILTKDAANYLRNVILTPDVAEGVKSAQYEIPPLKKAANSVIETGKNLLDIFYDRNGTQINYTKFSGPGNTGEPLDNNGVARRIYYTYEGGGVYPTNGSGVRLADSTGKLLTSTDIKNAPQQYYTKTAKGVLLAGDGKVLPVWSQADFAKNLKAFETECKKFKDALRPVSTKDKEFKYGLKAMTKLGILITLLILSLTWFTRNNKNTNTNTPNNPSDVSVPPKPQQLPPRVGAPQTQAPNNAPRPQQTPAGTPPAAPTPAPTPAPSQAPTPAPAETPKGNEIPAKEEVDKAKNDAPPEA